MEKVPLARLQIKEYLNLNMLSIPKIAATLNLTPDSFSDGGVHFSYDAAIVALERFIENGADIIDIGGESTRPNISYGENLHLGAINTIGHQPEWERIQKILTRAVQMVKGTNIKISLDSRNFDTFKKALDLGIDIINDVSGLADKRVAGLAKEYGCKIIMMHNLGLPANPKVLIDESQNPTEYIAGQLKEMKNILISEGVKPEQIILDPGIGFGNNSGQAVEILRNIELIKNIGSTVMVGHSRKSFLNQITTIPYSERDLETHVISIYLAIKNIDIIRVHDLLGTKRALAAAGLVF
jgi:dihydropteroate synthase